MPVNAMHVSDVGRTAYTEALDFVGRPFKEERVEGLTWKFANATHVVPQKDQTPTVGCCVSIRDLRKVVATGALKEYAYKIRLRFIAERTGSKNSVAIALGTTATAGTPSVVTWAGVVAAGVVKDVGSEAAFDLDLPGALDTHTGATSGRSGVRSGYLFVVWNSDHNTANDVIGTMMVELVVLQSTGEGPTTL